MAPSLDPRLQSQPSTTKQWFLFKKSKHRDCMLPGLLTAFVSLSQHYQWTWTRLNLARLQNALLTSHVCFQWGSHKVPEYCKFTSSQLISCWIHSGNVNGAWAGCRLWRHGNLFSSNCCLEKSINGHHISICWNQLKRGYNFKHPTWVPTGTGNGTVPDCCIAATMPSVLVWWKWYNHCVSKTLRWACGIWTGPVGLCNGINCCIPQIIGGKAIVLKKVRSLGFGN